MIISYTLKKKCNKDSGVRPFGLKSGYATH